LREPGIEECNVILESSSKGTVFSISFCALKILGDGPTTMILVMPCDQLLESSSKFHQATSFVRKNSANDLIVFGVKPKSAHFGYGYIEIGQQHNEQIFKVKSIKEKPNTKWHNSF